MCVSLQSSELETRSFLIGPYPAAAAVPVLAETGGTGQVTGEDDPASKPAAGAATAAGCPIDKNMFQYAAQINKAQKSINHLIKI